MLRTEFGLPLGLADTSTWAEVVARNDRITIPKRMEGHWKAQGKSVAEIKAAWNAYVPAHLLPRLTAFELKMAAYAIAHMKVGLKLTETGYTFGSDERLHVLHWAGGRGEMSVLAAERGIGFEKRVGRGADQRIEHEVRPGRADLGDDPVHVGNADRHVAIGQRLTAGVEDQVAGDATDLPPPDVVGPHQVAAAAEAREGPAQQWKQVLVRTGVGVDHVLGGLETLVGARVPQGAPRLLDLGDHLLAAPGRDAADDVAGAAGPRISAQSGR